MNKLKSNESGFSAVELILIIALVAALGVIGWMVYKNQKKAPVAVSTTKTTTASTTTSTTNVTKIAELGIQFTTSDTLKDFTYKVITVDYTGLGSYPTAYMSTNALNTAESGKCDIRSASTSKGTVPPLGFLTKTTGQYSASPTADNSTGTLVKQFPTYYIAYRSAGMSCFSQQANIDTVTSLNKQLSTALQSITEIK